MDNREDPNITIDELKRKLNHLSTLDQQRKVFGANLHKYESHPVSDVELEQLEDELGVHLPADYRQFLQVVGYGAGPYYGLLGPKQILDELKNDASERPDQLRAPDRPFPFSRQQAEECWRIMGERRCGWLVERTWPVDGCIPICYEGCSFYSLIVTAGDLGGCIWSSSMDSFDNGDDNLFYTYNLAPPPPGILEMLRFESMSNKDLAIEIQKPHWEPALSPEATFLVWYNAWLDQCLLDFMQGKGDQPDFKQGRGDQPVKAPFGRELFWWTIVMGLILAITILLSK